MKTEKNKALAGWMGVEWHEWEYESVDDDIATCVKCGELEAFHIFNPDYYTAEGRQVLLEWAVKQGQTDAYWWKGFIKSATGSDKWSGYSIPISILIPITAFADAVYEYLKEREENA